MGTKPVRGVAYSLNQPLTNMAPQPIVSKRDPTANDTAEIGTTWVNTATDSVFVITSVVAGQATWSTSPGSGVGTFTSVTIDPGDLHLTGVGGDIIVDSGDLDITSGDTTLGGNLDVTGDTVMTGNLDVTGDATFIGALTVTGDFDITDTASISLTSTNNAAGAITLDANGGAAETILIRSQQGTGADSLNFVSLAGGVTLQGNLATADAVNILSGATGGIDMDYGSAGMTITGANGAFTLASGTGAINIGTDAAQHNITIGNSTGTSAVSIPAGTGGVSVGANAIAHTITIGNSTGATGVALNGGSAGVSIGALAVAQPITIGNITTTTGVDINSGTGGIDLVSTGTGDITLTSGDEIVVDAAGVIAVNSTGGTISLGDDADAFDMNIGTGAAARIITVGNITTTTAVNVNSGTGGIALVSTGAGDITAASGDTLLLDSVGVLELNSSAGVISIGNDAVAQNINIGTGAAARTITIGNVSTTTALVLNSGTGGVAIGSTTTGDVTITSSDTVLIDGAGVVEINSSGGVISVGNDAVAQNINVGTGAAARVITIGNVSGTTAVNIDTGTGGSAFTTTNGAFDLETGTGAINIGRDLVAKDIVIGNATGATSLSLVAGTGSLSLVSTGSGDITAASSDTLLLDAAGVLELNSSAGAINVGNDNVNQAINVGTAGQRAILMGNATAGTTFKLNAPANVGITLQNDLRIITGAGDPNGAVTAPAGSLWLRTDPAGATSRAYLNTDSGTTWTNFTMAA